VKAIGADVPVLSGLIANFTEEAVERAKAAEAAGARGLQVFPPPSFLGGALDPGQAAGFVEAIAEATEIPLIVYRPPRELGYGIDEPVLRRLVEIEGVAALKESSFDPAIYPESRALIESVQRDVLLLSGADTFVVDSMEMGFDGLALAIAAVAPELCVELLRSWRRDRSVSTEARTALDAIAATIFAPPFRDFRARLKEGLRQQGVIRGADVRPPLAGIDGDAAAAVTRMLDQCDLARAA
jgi:dihydrodipicolinate synthase/N-acetylneuraminate lyase